MTMLPCSSMRGTPYCGSDCTKVSIAFISCSMPSRAISPGFCAFCSGSAAAGAALTASARAAAVRAAGTRLVMVSALLRGRGARARHARSVGRRRPRCMWDAERSRAM
jgi:hypothetical protein